MTIDEAIIFCNEKSENIKLKAEPQVFIEIAEMLEELKCYRNNNDFSEYADKLYKTAYNKAIDDFAEELNKDYRFDSICRDDVSFYEYSKKINRIAEQLKAGVVDESLHGSD